LNSPIGWQSTTLLRLRFARLGAYRLGEDLRAFRLIERAVDSGL
jgi:hypothetical protein